MAFHLAAFTAAQAIVTAPTQLAGVQDSFLPLTAGNNYLMPRALNIAAAVAQGLTMSLAQLSTPSLRPISPPHIQPVLQSATIPSLVPVAYFGPDGPKVKQNEELSALTNSTAAAERQHVLAWLHDGNVNWNNGSNIITIHATSTNTGAADVWTASSLTFDQTLESGNYRIVGMDAVGTRLVAARLLFTTGGFRPGVLARPSFAILPNPIFRAGNFGSFGDFPQTAPPTVECMFTGGVGTTQDFFFDVVRI